MYIARVLNAIPKSAFGDVGDGIERPMFWLFVSLAMYRVAVRLYLHDARCRTLRVVTRCFNLAECNARLGSDFQMRALCVLDSLLKRTCERLLLVLGAHVSCS